MAAQVGWPPSELRSASLAELWACFSGRAKAEGWFRDMADTSDAALSRLDALMERYPDG